MPQIPTRRDRKCTEKIVATNKCRNFHRNDTILSTKRKSTYTLYVLKDRCACKAKSVTYKIKIFFILFYFFGVSLTTTFI